MGPLVDPDTGILQLSSGLLGPASIGGGRSGARVQDLANRDGLELCVGVADSLKTVLGVSSNADRELGLVQQ